MCTHWPCEHSTHWHCDTTCHWQGSHLRTTQSIYKNSICTMSVCVCMCVHIHTSAHILEGSLSKMTFLIFHVVSQQHKNQRTYE